MHKKLAAKTARKETRSSHQKQETSNPQSGDDSASHTKDHDDNYHTTPQSTTDTSVTSATEDPQLTVLGPSGKPPLVRAGQLPEHLTSSFGPLLLDWESSVPFLDFTNFDPQGELIQEVHAQSSISHEFTTPSPLWAESAGRHSTWPTFEPHPPQQLSDRDYSAFTDMSMATGMKRKADSDSSLVNTTTSTSSVSKRPSIAGRGESSKTAAMRVQATTQSVVSPEDSTRQDPTSTTREDESMHRSESASKEAPYSSTSRKIAEISARLNPVLPAGKVFPIRIGSELFQLSGASISSDAPSYFSHYFGEQLLQTGGKSSAVKTLYIDRDPATFRDIALHLQGYHITPRDGSHYVKLFADAQFYSLPRLTQLLFKSEIFIQVGERHFQIPRETFSTPGDLPNYFSLGFAHFFSTPNEAFPGLDGQSLLRPPSILPPSVPNHDGDIFADLLRILQGYDVNVRDEAHRKELIRDAKYFHLRGVEQKLLPYSISYNQFRNKTEITMLLEDLRQSGISVTTDPDSPQPNRDALSTSKPATPHSAYGGTDNPAPTGWVSYQRPFVDEEAHELIVETSEEESTHLDLSAMRATFHGRTKARITSLFQVIANKMNLPATMPLGLMMMQSGGGVAAQPISPANSGVSGDKVRVRIGVDAHVELDGETLEWENADGDDDEVDEDELPKIKGDHADVTPNGWVVRKGLWRLRVEIAERTGRTEVVMCVVKMEAYSTERARNGRRQFLS